MLPLPWYSYLLITLAGLVAGIINTLAGSGSLITIGLMTFLGIPIQIANGSNRIGILLQTMVTSNEYRRRDALDTKGGLILSLPALVGAVLGAMIAVNLNEAVMRRVIGLLMVAMLLVVVARPRRWLEGSRTHFEGVPSVWQLLTFFAIGVYGGFIQAGVGIFLLSGLVLGAGYNLVRANAVKSLIALVFTIAAIPVFIKNGHIWWTVGLALAIGNMAGGWLAARMSVEKGPKFVRGVLIAVIILSAINLLFRG